MKCEGYKISGYDATYQKTVFDVNERNGVLEVSDINTGAAFLIDLNDLKEIPRRIGVWRKHEVKKNGVLIHKH